MSAIPRLTRSNVLAAIGRIDREGVPPRRKATKYALVHQHRWYPPKYVMSLAVEDATGSPLPPQEFFGGGETNSVLSALGFQVITTIRDADAPGPEAPPPRALIGRVVVTGAPPTEPHKAEAMLLEVLERRWPAGQSVKFLITPGGFVEGALPEPWKGECGWDSTADDLPPLVKRAEGILKQVVTGRVRRAARVKVDIITVGLDLVGKQFGAELVAVVSLQKNSTRWTGKSYPTVEQQHYLVHVADLRSHLLRIAGERVVVLGL